MKAKICGITCLDDALNATVQGAFALGFNFSNDSPRSISIQKAVTIIKHLPPEVITVAIDIEADTARLLGYLEHVDTIQIYPHQEDQKLPFDRVIFALNTLKEEDLPQNLSRYAFILLDAPSQSPMGGSGRLANWSLAKSLAKHYRLILAGGLNTKNLAEAINFVKPFAVDVASGIESLPGRKEPQALQHFLRICHE